MSKIPLDKYYTSVTTAKYCIDVLKSLNLPITEYLEPSAGNGSFSNQLDCLAYDIAPEHKDIIKQDFLKLNLPYKKGRCVIGNPPFGKGNNLCVAFIKKAYSVADYVAFILPISLLKNNIRVYEFDMIHSEKLLEQEYSDVLLKTCFNIYKRPLNGFNKKPCFKLNEIDYYLYSRNRDRDVPLGFDYSICSWGAVGKKPQHIGQYCNETYFYIKSEPLKEKILNVLKTTDWKKIGSNLNAECVSWHHIAKQLKEQIPELTWKKSRIKQPELF